MSLLPKEACLIRLFNAAGCHQWDRLAPLAREFYDLGGSLEELVATTRFLVTLIGYGPALKATLTLHKAGFMPKHVPGKVGGPPGNAFELVYTSVTDTVRAKLHDADPVLAEWIRTHLYGDIYSSPGIPLRLKQLLICSNLAMADMPDQLFGHAIAGLRFGATLQQLEEAVHLAVAVPEHSIKPAIVDEALKILTLAQRKYRRDFAGSPASQQVAVAFGSVRIPPLAPLTNGPPSMSAMSGTVAEPTPKPTQVRHVQMVTEKTIAAAPKVPKPAAGSVSQEGFAWDVLESERPPM
ncbi:hypothetical protein F751_6540 [Auxenochlorella protothecoides]|nr:hypothetical protein F751_6540 [Auxenochlorella protothecoides]KFM29021.1 hypothetical protein F751_6540 [Auxenochlorella protothecoides]